MTLSCRNAWKTMTISLFMRKWTVEKNDLAHMKSETIIVDRNPDVHNVTYVLL